MRKRNDAIVSDSITVADGQQKRNVGTSKFEVSDSVNLVASTTMSISAGTISVSGDFRAESKGGSKLWMSNSVSISASTTMSISAGTVSIYGDVLLKSIAQTSSEQKILYMSDSGSVYYRTGIPLSLVLSASNSTGENDILFLNGRKSYSTHNGLTSSYTFASGTSVIRSEGSKDYSNSTFASQSTSAVASKFIGSSIWNYSKLDLNYNNGYSNAEIISSSEYSANGNSTHTVSGLLSQEETMFSYLYSKNNGITASSSIGVVNTKSVLGFNTSLDRQATISLDSAGYMMTNLGNRDKYGYSPNTRYSSSSFLTKSTAGAENIVEIVIPKRGNVNYVSPPGPTHSVPVSIKAWIIANSHYSTRSIYKAEIDALFIATSSTSPQNLFVGGLEAIYVSTTETGNIGLMEPGRELGCGISTDGQSIFIGVSQSHTEVQNNPVLWKVHYEYILGDWYGSVDDTYTKSLYE